MRILHLEASPGWGGQEIRVLLEAQKMVERGHRVTLGVMKGGKLIPHAKRAGIPVYELDFRRCAWPFCLFQILRILRLHRIDLVNTHSSLDGWIGGIAARLAGRPIVRTRHLSTPIKKGWNSRLLYGKLADFVITTCSAIIPMICDQSEKRPEKCRSIATGVDPERILIAPGESEAWRTNLNIGPKDFLVGTACFMRSWKGIETFLQAAHRLRYIPEIRWVIIGGGHEETFRRKARELRLDGVVIFTGHLENPFPALAALDLFALLSTANEGVSQAILQAAYLEKALIATPVGGLGEVCLDRQTGLQVPPFSSEEVVRAVLELKENSALRKQLGQKGRHLVESRFLLRHTVDQMEEVYRSLVSAPH